MFFANISFANADNHPNLKPPVLISDSDLYLNGAYAENYYIKEFVKDAVKFWGGLPEHCVNPLWNEETQRAEFQGLTITNTKNMPDEFMYDEDNLAYADLGGCKMTLNDRNKFWPTSYNNYLNVCNTITHELGHNFGYDHVNDFKHIMHAFSNNVNPYCLRWKVNKKDKNKIIKQSKLLNY